MVNGEAAVLCTFTTINHEILIELISQYKQTAENGHFIAFNMIIAGSTMIAKISKVSSTLQKQTSSVC